MYDFHHLYGALQIMGTPEHRFLQHTYTHRLGRAVIHRGTQRHGADDIVAGQRLNLIIWNHNSDFRRSPQHAERQLYYAREGGPPHPTCMSYTHDKDWAQVRGAYPQGKEAMRGRGWCPPRGKEHLPASTRNGRREL